MSEELQTRTEHSRSLEDADRYRALETLKEVGLLVPLTELETFHGRVASADEEVEWAVDPSFANGSNDSGNYNVNNRPTLYTGDKDTAQDFADERSGFKQLYHSHLLKKAREYTPEENVGRLERQNAWMKKVWEEDIAAGKKDVVDSGPTVWTMDQLLASNPHVEAFHLRDSLGKQAYDDFKQQYADRRRAEVHEIVTGDTDATVLDFSFDESKLDDEAKAKYRQALRALAIPITEGSPVSWDARNEVSPFVGAMQKAKKYFVLKNDISSLAADAGIDEQVALQLASAKNSRQVALQKPSYLLSQLLEHSQDIITDSLEDDGERQEFPINLEYVQRYLRENHIVGVRQSLSSATLNKDITSVSFFDLEKTITAKGLETERLATWHRLGSVATSLGLVMRPEVEQKQPLLRLLEDAHAKPDKLVAAAKMVEGYEDIFNGDAGNWEGFSLAEHTETVLRNFDESYAENLPVELLAPMRLAILSHDVGKPIASARGEKQRQKEYNAAQADDFLGKLGVDERLKDLLLTVIGDGEDLAFQIEVRGAGETAVKAMRELAVNTLQKFYSSENVTNEQINGFTEMCKMIQVCDGGTYTSMAITRREGGNGRHRNAPSFNSSFAQPVGFGKRTIRLRGEDDKAAASDLTPQAAENQSRVKISHRGAGRRAPNITT